LLFKICPKKNVVYFIQLAKHINIALTFADMAAMLKILQTPPCALENNGLDTLQETKTDAVW